MEVYFEKALSVRLNFTIEMSIENKNLKVVLDTLRTRTDIFSIVLSEVEMLLVPQNYSNRHFDKTKK